MEVYISESAQDDPQERWVMLKQPDVSKICEAMIQVMESGLPPEARTMDAFDLILKECRERLHRKRILLIPDSLETPVLPGEGKEADRDVIQD